MLLKYFLFVKKNKCKVISSRQFAPWVFQSVSINSDLMTNLEQ